MTTPELTTPQTPPRVLIRAFWALHRAVYRFSGGRLGPWRPTTGRRFGVMGLTTTGRRSGAHRLVMVGYFEDGDELVTLAMNGWADTPPAWWLNLQANPEATVMLSDGPREVRARPAIGTEHDRLWARFDEFPGWGDALEARMRGRSIETPIVVFAARR